MENAGAPGRAPRRGAMAFARFVGGIGLVVAVIFTFSGRAHAAEPTAPATAITLSLDSTFIRSCEEGSRHLEVRLGNVETPDGVRQVFAAVTKTDTAIARLIQRSLAAVGQSERTELSAFTGSVHGWLSGAAGSPGRGRRQHTAVS